MGKVRVIGLVKLADLVRRQLAGPVSAAALEALRDRVEATLEDIDLGLSDRALTDDALPAPSREAFRFLKGVDFAAVRTSADAADGPYLRGTVSLPGLSRVVQWLLDALSGPPDEARRNELHDTLRDRLEKIEDLLAREEIAPEHLKDPSRSALAWLRYFARRERFDAYVEAVARARPIFEREAAGIGQYPPPARIQFCTMAGLYRLRATRHGTRVSLPVPMITFSAEAFAQLAARAFRRAGVEEAIYQRLLRPEYQDALAEVEALCGRAEGSGAGAYHDLAAAFDRVNAAYFAARLTRPRLLWGRTFTMRKFGHYDHVHDTVMVSGSLDAADVPQAAVDFLVYHELLHREQGIGWRNGRRAVHTGEFHRAERRFRQYDQAKAALKKLAAGRS